MRAGMVYVKVPISTIEFDLPDEDVTLLRESIRVYGLLQPVGITKKDDGYKLIFGRRRVKACLELGQKYIHSVLLTVRGDDAIFRAVENIHRQNLDAASLAEYALGITEGDVREILCLDFGQESLVRDYLMLPEDAKKAVNANTEQFISRSHGDGTYFLKMCHALEDVPVNAKDKVRLSVLSDKRIFINEIEKILKLMRSGGYTDSITEDDECIIIRKKQGA